MLPTDQTIKEQIDQTITCVETAKHKAIKLIQILKQAIKLIQILKNKIQILKHFDTNFEKF